MDILPIAWAGYCLSDCGTTYSGTCYHVIWDGTGAEDYGADWLRSGYGFEADYAAYAGTNGLDASDMPAGQVIYFDKILEPELVNDYDLLTFWINLHEYNNTSDINVRLHIAEDTTEYILKLSNYVNMSRTNVWQKVFIDLANFNVPGNNIYVEAVSLEATGPMSFYLDDAMFSVGAVDIVTVPIQDVELSTNFTEPADLSGDEHEPSVTQDFTEESKPVVEGDDLKPSVVSALDKFPKPRLS
jgi:hypothetical protein